MKDATEAGGGGGGAALGFNPRAREGRDQSYCFFIVIKRCFNPRAREGRDVKHHKEFHFAIVSIHAPVKDATD